MGPSFLSALQRVTDFRLKPPAILTVQLLEAVSKLFVVVLRPKSGDSQAPCAGNSGAIFKHYNAASVDFRPQPEGPGPFFCISALLAAH